MATKIVTKNSSTASAIPTASDLVQGELAVNVADKRLFTEDNGGAIVELGTNPYNFTANHDGSAKLATTATGIDVTGTVTADGATIDGTLELNSNSFNHTALTPSYNFIESDVTGENTQFLQASGTLRIRTVDDSVSNPVERMRIDHGTGDISFYDDSGNAKFFWDASAESLGIGTSPAKPFHVQDGSSGITAKAGTVAFIEGSGNTKVTVASGATSTGELLFGRSTDNDAGRIIYDHNDNSLSSYTAGAERMRIDSSGNVGIGTSSPRSLINASSATGAILTLESSDTSLGEGDVVGQIDFYANDASTNSTGNKAFIKAYSETAGGNKVGLDFATSSSSSATGVTAMTIDSSGNVGIGTSSPNFTLQLDSNRADATFDANNLDTWADFKIQGQTASGNARGIYFDFDQDTGNDKGAGIVGISGDASGGVGSLGFITTSGNVSAERMRIDSSGNLLVGTTSAAGADGLRVARDVTNTSVGVARFDSTAASDQASTAASFVKTSNDSTTSQTFIRFAIDSFNSGCGQINANGSGAAAFGSFSDMRLKENITNLPNQLSNITALRPVEFDYIESEGGGHQIGFIAQEVESIYPDLVGEREDGMKTLTGIGKMEARLIKAIQEQQTLIESLTTRIAALETGE